MGISKEEIAELIELENKVAFLVEEHKNYKLNNEPSTERSVVLAKMQIEIRKDTRRLRYLRSLENEGE